MLWRECGLGCGETHEEEGVIQRYVHLTREFEAPASYHVFSLLAAVAAATNRRVVIDRRGYRLWPNLYVLLHGPSGLGKGIASGHAIDLIRAHLGDALRLYPEDLTGEGLFKLMAKQTEVGEPCVGLVYSDEFSELLGGQTYKEDFAKRLTRLYACPDDTGTGRSKYDTGELWVKNVFLNIIGCSQEDWLRELPVHAIKGGLFARILVVPETRVRHRKYEPQIDMRLANEIGAEIVERLEGLPEHGIVGQTEAARALGMEWYGHVDEHRMGKHPLVLPWMERRLDHAIKLGYLNSLLEGDQGPVTIDEDGLRWGIEMVEMLTPKIERVFTSMQETQVGELNRQIGEVVAANGGAVQEYVVRQALGYKWRRGAMDEAIRHLIETGTVTRQERADPRFGTAFWLIETRAPAHPVNGEGG